MPRHPHRPASIAPACALLALLSLASIPGTSLAAAAPAAATPRAGDPDIPAQAAPPGASILRRDLHRLVAAPTLRLWAVGAALALAAHDRENPDRAEATLGAGVIDAPADLGNLYGSGAVLGTGSLLLYGLGRFTGDPNLRGAGGEMIRSLAYSTAVVTALKVAVHRTRPNGGPYSFPSGHTTVAFAVAPVLSRRFGLRAAIPAYTMAVATGLGRMEDRKHYLSDVVMGAAIGLSIGRAVVGPGAEGTGPQLSLRPGGAEVAICF